MTLSLRSCRLLRGLRRSRALLPYVITTAIAVLSAALCSGAQAKSSSGELAPLEAAPAAAAPWWSAFHEQPLDDLQQAAAAHAAKAASPVFLPAVAATDGASAPLELQVAADYIGVRMLTVRAMLVDEMLRTINRQRELLAGTAPLRTQTPPLAALDAEFAQARQRSREMRGNRDALIADLARLCGHTPVAMQARLQTALADPTIPVLDRIAPSAMPAPEHTGDIFDDMQARDIDASRRAVLRQSERTRTWAEIVHTRRTEVETARQRMALGAQPEFSVLATYRVMLVDNDRLADSAGELAKAWLQLQLLLQQQAAARPLQASGPLSP